MYQNFRIIALIPARGGSKGIKNKNITILAGKPLIDYTIEAALASKYVDYVFVSTDNEQIAEEAYRCGAKVPFLRAPEFAQDDSKTIDAVIYSLTELKKHNLEFDILVLLQPTSPLRSKEDIDSALETYFEHGQKAMASVSLVQNNPVLIRTIDASGKLNALLQENSTVRRQEMKDYYYVNGSIYINSISELNANVSFNDNSIAYIMPFQRSVDIDEIIDLKLAECLIKGN